MNYQNKKKTKTFHGVEMDVQNKNFNQFYVNVFIYFHFFHCSASRVTRQSSLVLLENKVIAYFQSYCRTMNQIKNT